MTRYAKPLVIEVCHRASIPNGKENTKGHDGGETPFEPPHPHESEIWGTYGEEHKFKHIHHHL